MHALTIVRRVGYFVRGTCVFFPLSLFFLPFRRGLKSYSSESFHVWTNILHDCVNLPSPLLPSLIYAVCVQRVGCEILYLYYIANIYIACSMKILSQIIFCFLFEKFLSLPITRYFNVSHLYSRLISYITSRPLTNFSQIRLDFRVSFNSSRTHFFSKFQHTARMFERIDMNNLAHRS